MGEAEVVSLACASSPEITENRSITRNSPVFLVSCLPASSRQSALVYTGPKWLTEDPVLPSTIRHQY